MDGMIGTLEMVAYSDWCSILPAALCDLDIDGKSRTLSPLDSPSLITDYVLITSASRELSPLTKFFSEKICEEIKNISEKLNQRVRKHCSRYNGKWNLKKYNCRNRVLHY